MIRVAMIMDTSGCSETSTARREPRRRTPNAERQARWRARQNHTVGDGRNKRKLPIHLASVTYTSDTVAFLEKHLHLTGEEFYSRADIDAALSDLIDETVRADK
jgi:hypothetical protein